MDLDIKWWKKKSLSWEPPQILCWTRDAGMATRHRVGPLTLHGRRCEAETRRGPLTSSWSSDHPLLMTLDSVTGLFISRSSSNESLMFQEQEVVMMHEVLGGQKDKLRKQTGSTPCEDMKTSCCPGISTFSVPVFLIQSAVRIDQLFRSNQL
ncbi:hypothetical protein NQZ68_032878 [Dissostichus eleginoides]|nr:hypothetical protein NQZ68_032878 [Dissostichus eleginoides]